MINKHKSNKIKKNSNTVRHLNNGTDHRHSKSCCDQSSPARRTIMFAHGFVVLSLHMWMYANRRRDIFFNYIKCVDRVRMYTVHSFFVFHYIIENRKRVTKYPAPFYLSTKTPKIQTWSVLNISFFLLQDEKKKTVIYTSFRFSFSHSIIESKKR